MHTHPPPDRGKMPAMLDAARAVGITRVIMSSLGYTDMVPYPSPEDVRRGNEEVLSLIDRYPGLVYGYVYVNPNHCRRPQGRGGRSGSPGCRRHQAVGFLS